MCVRARGPGAAASGGPIMTADLVVRRASVRHTAAIDVRLGVFDAVSRRGDAHSGKMCCHAGPRDPPVPRAGQCRLGRH